MADTTWLTAVDPTLGIDLLVSFPAPSGPLTSGTDNQVFHTRLRKTAGAPNPIVDIDLYEYDGDSWNFVATLTNDLAIASTTEQVDEHSWDVSMLTDPSYPAGCRIIGTPGVD